LLFVQKNLTYSLIRSLHSRGYGNEKVLIYGSGYTGRRVFSVLRRSPKLGLEPVVFVDDDPSKAGTVVFETGYERRSSAPIAPGPLDRNLISRFGVDLVIVAIPSIGLEKFVRTIEEALVANARISFVPSHLLPSDPWVDYQDIDGVLLASFGRTSRVGYDILKRICDFAGSLLLMVVGLPIFLLLALIIRLDSSGPILFRQERVGHNGELFKMFKFRTMHASAPAYEYSPRASDDCAAAKRETGAVQNRSSASPGAVRRWVFRARRGGVARPLPWRNPPRRRRKSAPHQCQIVPFAPFECIELVPSGPFPGK